MLLLLPLAHLPSAVNSYIAQNTDRPPVFLDEFQKYK